MLIQGRSLRPADIEWLRDWIGAHRQWSRKRLARELCEHWHWRDGGGRLKDFAARSLLLKLEARELIELPPLQVNKRRQRRRMPALEAPPPLSWKASLAEVAPVSLQVVQPGSEAARRWESHLHHHHYLGLHVVGENVGYLAIDAHGRDLACLLFGAPAWRCAPRDRFLGWSDRTRGEQLHTLANNTRFLILPWVGVPHLASHLLGRAARRINLDWQAKYAHGLQWLETFVEHGRFAGTCYRAANWRCVGQTTGRSRQDPQRTQSVPPKDIYLYGLGGATR